MKTQAGAAILFCTSAWLAFAQFALAGHVVTDGSLGAATTLTGPTFNVTPDLGKQVGTNLFHSFSQLNLDPGEVASFSGPTTITNVLARVTGGPSTINGTIQCTIQGANFYLINPSGVVFGPNASLDIRGSFAVTTAQEIHLSDGTVFGAPGAADALLTTAPPAAFGFTTSNPAAITVGNTSAPGPTLAVPAGNVLSIVGGAIQIVGGQIQAPGGRVNAVAAASTGTVTVDPSNVSSTLDVSTITQFADISLSNSSAIMLQDTVTGGGMGVMSYNRKSWMVGG